MFQKPSQLSVRPTALLAVVVLAGCASTSTGIAPEGRIPSHAQAAAALRGLQTNTSQLLEGGPVAFRRQITSLRGFPVVVNQWASWCGPCRYEFPFFQHLARRYKGQVAFLGVDSNDSRSDARAFLKSLPVPYPSYSDPGTSIAPLFRGGLAWPTTAFFDRAGKLVYVHPGGYAAEHVLDSDIVRYALHG